MSSQSYANPSKPYWARAYIEDQVAQLNETRLVIPLNEPDQYTIITADDQGSGLYPLSDNAGATLRSQVKILPTSDITNINSLQLVGSDNKIEVIENKLHYGGVQISTGEDIYGFQLESTFNDQVDPTPFVKRISISSDGNYICVSYSTTNQAFIYVRGTNGEYTLQQELTPLVNISVTALDAQGDRIAICGVPSYVFLRTGTSWTLEATLSDILTDGAIKINDAGDIIAITDSPFDSNAKLLIYQRVGTTWSLSQTILPDILPATIEIGYQIDMTPSGDKILYPNTYETTARLGCGTISVYTQDTLNNWVLEQKISPENPDRDYWGMSTNSVTINDSGDEIIAWVDPNNNHRLIRFNLIGGVWTQTQLTPLPDNRQLWKGYFLDSYFISLGTLFSKPNILLIFRKGSDGNYYFLNRGKDYTGATNYAVAYNSKTICISASGGLDVNVYKPIGTTNNTAPFTVSDNTIPIISFDDVDDKTYADSGVTINTGQIGGATAINLTTAAANPGTANTIWQQTSDGHLFRGSVDLEAGGTGDVVGPASSGSNDIVLFNGGTGKLIKDSATRVVDGATVAGLRIDKYVAGFPINETGNSNIVFGYTVGQNLSSGSFNTILGSNILSINNSAGVSAQNTLVGCNVATQWENLCTGNVVIGHGSANFLNAANDNVIIAGGGNATTNDDCIYISNQGVAAENTTTRIGSAQTSAYIAGIYNKSEPLVNSSYPVAINSDGLLSRYIPPVSELSHSDFVTPYTMTITLQNTFYELAPPTILSFVTNQSNKFDSPGDGRIRWLGSYTTYISFSMGFSMYAVTNNDVISFEFRKNGLVLPNSEHRTRFSGNTAYESFSTHLLINMDPNDYVSVFISNTTTTGNLVFGDINISAITH